MTLVRIRFLLVLALFVFINIYSITGWPHISFIPYSTQKASAAFSAITARGSALQTTNGSSLAVSPSAALTVGKIVIVSAVSDNNDTSDGATTFHSISDTDGHTWTKVFEETETDGASDDGSTTSLWWTKVRTEIATSDSITLTLGANKTDSIISIVEATVAAGNTVSTTTTTPTHSASGTSLSHSRSSLTSREYLFFGLFGAEGEDAAKTAIANYAEQFDLISTAAGNAVANVQQHVGTRILTGTGDTWTSSAVTFTNAIQSLTGFYEVTPTYEQASYRFFNATDTTDVGSALEAQNTAASLATVGDSFRLRALIHQGGGLLGSRGLDFKLQFAEQSGSCDTSFSGESYSDVTGTTVIAYDSGTSPSDGVSLTSNANDPTHSSDTVRDQTYEKLNNFTNSTEAIAVGEDGMWDFALIDNGATSDTAYCFRIVKSDASQLNTYSVIPQITTAAGTLGVDIVDSGGSTVASPGVNFTALLSSDTCQAGTGTLGTSSEKIRVTNGTGNAAWSLSIAATSGVTSNWSSGPGSYDFNDPGGSGCTDGGDADSLAGQLSIDPSVATNTPEGGCTATNVNLGSSSAFNQGTTDSITLVSASSGADTGCYWDITDIDLSQTVPEFQETGTYSVNMTLTVVAN